MNRISTSLAAATLTAAMAFSSSANAGVEDVAAAMKILDQVNQITAGMATKDVSTLPMWVVYSCYFAIAWGTYLGGWRIVKTMGTKITKLNSVSGSCASMGGAIALGLATYGGIPVSTTHTITGAIIGVGAANDMKAVKWAVTANLLVAWVLTIPLSGLVAAFFWYVGTKFL